MSAALRSPREDRTVRDAKPILALAAASLVLLAWAVASPTSRRARGYELVPGVVGVGLLAATYRRFRFSNLAYVLVGVHFAVLAVAARYGYPNVPLFNWLRGELGLARNHYDRVCHVAQGFVPAIVAREILVRITGLPRGKMLCFLVVSVCLAVSAAWELLEWLMVLIFCPRGHAAEWLGMQGDLWDTHWDMLLALLGALAALVVLSRLHDRSMAALPQPQEAPQAKDTGREAPISEQT